LASHAVTVTHLVHHRYLRPKILADYNILYLAKNALIEYLKIVRRTCP